MLYLLLYPLLLFVFRGLAVLQPLFCCSCLAVAEFRKSIAPSRLLDKIHKFSGCHLDKAVFTCVLYTVLLLLL